MDGAGGLRLTGAVFFREGPTSWTGTSYRSRRSLDEGDHRSTAFSRFTLFLLPEESGGLARVRETSLSSVVANALK
jgi:hypothetical protein